MPVGKKAPIPIRPSWAMWLASLAFEHAADHQKLFFIMECKEKKIKDAVCDVGLWRYRVVQHNSEAN